MPIDYQQIYQKIREIGAGAGERKKTLDERRARARDQFGRQSDQLELLRLKVDAAQAADPNIRCALPVGESLSAHFAPQVSAKNLTLIATDGSQISPDRNVSIQYCLVNVGAIAMQLDSGKVTDISTDSELLLEEEWERNYGPATEGIIALQRDIRERGKLEDMAKRYPAPVVTFTDGPMELWEPKNFDELKAFNAQLPRYLGVLSRLQEKGIITAGYIDKPAENLVIRLLEIASATPENLKDLRNYHPLQLVTDRWLFGELDRPLLPPGHRSAVFGIQSNSQKNYKGVLSLHFFYINVGSLKHPWPVRVEVPKWVADDPVKLNLLHTVLVEQCSMMGSNPYPYLLHRAHETAVVKYAEKEQLRQMLEQELRNQNEDIDSPSPKQTEKELPGRSRR